MPTWVKAIVAAVIVAALGIVGYGLTVGSAGSVAGESKPSAVVAAAKAPASALKAAHQDCHTGSFTEAADGENTLAIDTTQAYDPAADVAAAWCVLNEIHAPVSMTTRLERTRATDGEMTAEWDQFTAIWTFRPTNVLTLIITEK